MEAETEHLQEDKQLSFKMVSKSMDPKLFYVQEDSTGLITIYS